jgi:quercetin dioxygenase-like cupin family protein
MEDRRQVRVLDSGPSCPSVPMIDGAGTARAVVWPGVGAEARSMVRLQLQAGARTSELRHPMEAVYYVVAGSGRTIDAGSKAEAALIEGSMIHIEPGTPYRIAAGPEGIELVGGPCPADPALFADLAS